MKTIIILIGISLSTLIILSHNNKHAITRAKYNDLQQRLIISEALVKKCAEKDTIDIMLYVRDVKREIEVEFNKD